MRLLIGVVICIFLVVRERRAAAKADSQGIPPPGSLPGLERPAPVPGLSGAAKGLARPAPVPGMSGAAKVLSVVLAAVGLFNLAFVVIFVVGFSQWADQK